MAKKTKETKKKVTATKKAPVLYLAFEGHQRDLFARFIQMGLSKDDQVFIRVLPPPIFDIEQNIHLSTVDLPKDTTLVTGADKDPVVVLIERPRGKSVSDTEEDSSSAEENDSSTEGDNSTTEDSSSSDS